ncbi:hypothetical protein L950_0224515 [Sphingobacterium sp. IITKGP-BTPF85]|nr:hypothetical protein L950_0224515 [Sphingobacterium sp. IITKGP-BTPF85]
MPNIIEKSSLIDPNTRNHLAGKIAQIPIHYPLNPFKSILKRTSPYKNKLSLPLRSAFFHIIFVLKRTNKHKLTLKQVAPSQRGVKDSGALFLKINSKTPAINSNG